MRYGKLRIAWSVVCGLVAVLLTVLWVRSYWWEDVVVLPMRIIGSREGAIGMISWPRAVVPVGQTGWIPISRSVKETASPAQGPSWRFSSNQNQLWIVCPHWFLGLAATTLTIAPWLSRLRWRFSTRTLLIATTLVAIVLGLIVAM